MTHSLRYCYRIGFAAVAASFFVACGPAPDPEAPGADVSVDAPVAEPRPEIYAEFPLTADLSQLTDRQQKMIPILISASEIMDQLFWLQAYGQSKNFLSTIEDPSARRFAEINYGPWDRLAGDQPFLMETGEKPKGAQFYPSDMSVEEFNQASLDDKDSLYTLLQRDGDGQLLTVKYSDAYATQLAKAADLLRQAAELAEDEGFRHYLELRATALETDDYQPSDLAWLDMKSNDIDVVIGAIETYEDLLFGYKAAYEAYVLLKDKAWSERLAQYAQFLPELQEGLPVDDQYKQEKPGTDSDLNAYDVIYYAGHSNAGSKTIAINLPNDEQVQLQKGTRRLQLKNAMRAKFDKILVPLADELLVEDQRKHIKFEAFFGNTMFHEVAHGLGIKNTINGAGPVRTALKETASAIEEGKADVLGLYMITSLFDRGELDGDTTLEDYYVTFMASIFRSVRFGASSAHGKANMVRFNFFADRGAFQREPSGLYRVDFERMRAATDELSARILTLQGEGDYSGAQALLEELGVIGETLQEDLDKLSDAGVPVDIVFSQGLRQLDLS